MDTEVKRARLAQLPRLTTEELIVQYDRAVWKPSARYNENGRTALQRRIDMIVDMLSERADAGDSVALKWFKS